LNDRVLILLHRDLIILTSLLLFPLFLLFEVIYVDRYIYIYMHKLAESRIFTVTLYSSNIDTEFVASIEKDVSATNERYQILILAL
jgi:hypothetical protein